MLVTYDLLSNQWRFSLGVQAYSTRGFHVVLPKYSNKWVLQVGAVNKLTNGIPYISDKYINQWDQVLPMCSDNLICRRVYTMSYRQKRNDAAMERLKMCW